MKGPNEAGYKPGALMRDPEQADSLTVNFSTATTGSWVTITTDGVTPWQIVFTPDSDCFVEVVLRAQVAHSAANAIYDVGVEVNGGVEGQSIAPIYGAAGQILSISPIITVFTGTAGVTYTIIGKVYNQTAGTLYVYKGLRTKMYIKVFKKP